MTLDGCFQFLRVQLHLAPNDCEDIVKKIGSKMGKAPDEFITHKVDYELQLLKMIAVGWSLLFYLQQHPAKEALQVMFWQAIS